MKKVAKKTAILLTNGLSLVVFFCISSHSGQKQFSVDGTVAKAGYAYPVPFNPKLDKKITFPNLAENSEIRIFSISGDLVKTLHECDSEGNMIWNANNEEGSPVSSDVYVYRIQSGNEVKIGKLVVVR